jgi:hypothetical protein
VPAGPRRFWLAPSGGCASEHLGESAFRERIAGLHAEPVRGHRRGIVSAGYWRAGHRLVAVPEHDRKLAVSNEQPCRTW